MQENFWETKTLQEMSPQEWEALCDGCGKCCLVKLEDEDTGEIHHTSVSCRLFDCSSCTCLDYENRFIKIDDCISITPENISHLSWLPDTCAYVKIWRGEKLESWHYLISGSRETVHQEGKSMHNKVTSEAGIKDEDSPDYIDPDILS